VSVPVRASYLSHFMLNILFSLLVLSNFAHNVQFSGCLIGTFLALVV